MDANDAIKAIYNDENAEVDFSDDSMPECLDLPVFMRK